MAALMPPAGCREWRERSAAWLVLDHPRVGPRRVGHLLQFLDREADMRHAERREDTGAGEVFPGLAADPLGHHAGDHVAEVLYWKACRMSRLGSR